MAAACPCPVSYPGPTLAACGGASTLYLFMAVVEHFLRAQCDVEDPCGQVTPRARPDHEYDFIVVGAGSAGAVVANRLSEVAEWRVLLVEAGGNEPTSSQVPSLWENAQDSPVDWQFRTEPEGTTCLNTGGVCHYPRGKVIGGTSVINGLLYMRGNKKDFDNWETVYGNRGWSYKDVLPYFIKSEDNLQANLMDPGYHGVGGYQPVSWYPYFPPIATSILEAARELGQRIGDLNGRRQTGFCRAQTVSRNGVRYSSARAFLRPVKNRANLHILLKTTVLRVLVDNKLKQTYGVEILTALGIRRKILARKEVVLCAGAISSPQILLASGIGNRKDLNRVNVPVVYHLPGVGRNFHNHVAYGVKFNTSMVDTTFLNWATLKEYLLFRDGPMSGTGANIIGMIQTKFANPTVDYPDIEFLFNNYEARCSKTGRAGEISGKIVDGVLPQRQILMYSTLIQPRSRCGYLTLRNNNPLSYPRIFPRYFTNPLDIATIIEGIKFAIRLSKTKALQKFGLEVDRTPVRGCENIQFGSDAYWECAIRRDTFQENHQAGTCKMSPASDPLAVVDAELRVHGLRGLRVVDASIMPKVAAGNLHAPAMMIGEKGADMIKKSWLLRAY